MKAVVICGGFRGGISSTICDVVSEHLGADAVYLEDHDIGYCRGCDRCKDGDCIIRDDLPAIADKVTGSDLVVMVVPLRFNGVCSLMKTFMERFQPCWHHRRECGKIALISVAGSANPNFDPLVREMRAFSITAGIEWIGELLIPGTDEAFSWKDEYEEWLDTVTAQV